MRRSGTSVSERFAYLLFTEAGSGYNLQPEPVGATIRTPAALGGFLEIRAV